MKCKSAGNGVARTRILATGSGNRPVNSEGQYLPQSTNFT